MNNNSFTTDTDVRYAQFQFFKPLLFVGIFLSLLACLGFLIAWQTFVFFESIVIVVCLVGYLSGKGKSDWNLHFDNDVLTLTNNANGQTYSVWDIPASDIVIKQSKQDIKRDYCNLVIKNTVFGFYGVRRCSALREYIKQNYR